jgi:hypothetical protein
MKKLVFGLGLSQVVLTILAALAGHALLAWAFAIAGKRGLGLDWQGAIALGSALAMSSTAIVVKLMADRLELESEHGPPRHGRAAVPGPGRGAVAGADSRARLVARSAVRCASRSRWSRRGPCWRCCWSAASG